MIGRLLCAVGLHRFRGTSVPHTYRCVRDHPIRRNGVRIYRQCQATEAGYP